MDFLHHQPIFSSTVVDDDLAPIAGLQQYFFTGCHEEHWRSRFHVRREKRVEREFGSDLREREREREKNTLVKRFVLLFQWICTICTLISSRIIQRKVCGVMHYAFGIF